MTKQSNRETHNSLEVTFMVLSRCFKGKLRSAELRVPAGTSAASSSPAPPRAGSTGASATSPSPTRSPWRPPRARRESILSVTWTCPKRDFSSIFVGYSSRIFDDFHGFSQISSFLRVVLSASRMQMAAKPIHFLHLVWIRAIFG